MNITYKFEQIVTQYNDRVALASEYEGELSYRELNNYANYIAQTIIINGLNKRPIIGICISRSFKMIATMLGVLKAGLAYVPIDPSYPSERISYYIENSEIEYILCDENSKKAVSEKYRKIVLPKYSNINEENVQKFIDEEGNKLAYVQYTSGSTGTPRGVMISHDSIMNTLQWQIDYYHLNERDVVLQIPSYAFASSVEDIYSTLLSGGKLVLIKSKDLLRLSYLNRLVDKYKITHFIMVPSLYREFISYLRKNSTLRFVIIAGEPFNQEIIKRHYDILPGVKLYNEYGMTETSVACFATMVKMENIPNIIGSLIPNMQAKIMEPDEDGIGELYVSGSGLAQGYHKDDEGTKEKFVNIGNVLYFKTGDYVKRNQDGLFIHMGRKDKQIKVSGQRVNLSEIDNVLSSLEGVTHVSSTVVKIKGADKILTFIEGSKKDVVFYKDYLSAKLPVYYMPSFIKVVNSFEYLPNRKINIKKMKDEFMENYNEELLRNNTIVLKLIEEMKECSDDIIKNVDLDRDIREQGLSSIQFIQFIAQIEEKFEFEFGYDDLERIAPVSIKALYEYISTVER